MDKAFEGLVRCRFDDQSEDAQTRIGIEGLLAWRVHRWPAVLKRLDEIFVQCLLDTGVW